MPKQPASLLDDDVISAFNSDGFVYLGKMQLSKGPKLAGAATPAAVAAAGITKSKNGRPVLPAHVSAIRYTPQGHIYIMKASTRVQNEAGSRAGSIAAAASTEAPVILPNIPPSVLASTAAAAVTSSSVNSSSSFEAEVTRRRGRALSIIVGADERKLCATGAPYPLSAIGQIDFLERNTPFICTGTLITNSLVLSAAHCVWDVESQTFADMVTFAPGRYRLPDGKVINPHGSYNWSHATLMKNYLTSGEGQADIALIKLDGTVPAAAGTMGLKTDCSNNSTPEKNLPVTTAGYPSGTHCHACSFFVKSGGRGGRGAVHQPAEPTHNRHGQQLHRPLDFDDSTWPVRSCGVHLHHQQQHKHKRTLASSGQPFLPCVAHQFANTT